MSRETASAASEAVRGHFGDRLLDSVDACGSPVVLGLDPHLSLFPPPLADDAASLVREVAAGAVARFCEEVLEAVSGTVAAVKPQVAFFERLGPAGWTVLEEVVRQARDLGFLVIADAKRGDIGSTATAYAEYFLGADTGLEGIGADALTVNPYLGSDSLAPFARAHERGRGLFILAKTSNPSSAEIQDLELAEGAEPLYVAVARMASRLGAEAIGERGYSSIGIVVGATSPHQAGLLRAAFPELLFLVPGFGAQGAGAGDVVGAFDADGRGALVNASRSLLFAYQKPAHSALAPDRWAEATRREAESMTAALREALAAREVPSTD